MACTTFSSCIDNSIGYLPLHTPMNDSEQTDKLEFSIVLNIYLHIQFSPISSDLYCLYSFNSCFRQWLKSEDIQRISLFFHNKSLEKEVRWMDWRHLPLSGSTTMLNLKRISEHIVPACSFVTLSLKSCKLQRDFGRLSRQFRSCWANCVLHKKKTIFEPDLFILPVQSNNLAGLQILCYLRLFDLFLHFYCADSRPSKVCVIFWFCDCGYGCKKQYFCHKIYCVHLENST